MFAKTASRLWIAVILILCLTTALYPAQARAAAVWDGYPVIAEHADGDLRAAVVLNADTGGRMLLIGETQNGTFTITGRGEHAIPETWADSDLSVEAHRAVDAFDQSRVIVRAKQEGPLHLPLVTFGWQSGGWHLLRMDCRRGDAWYSLSISGGSWFASVETDKQRNGAHITTLQTDLACFDYTQAMDRADTAIAERIQWETEVAQTQRQEALTGTPWESAAMTVLRNYPANGNFLVTIAALQTDAQTGLGIFNKTESGSWTAVVNPRILPRNTATDGIEISFPYYENSDADNASTFTLSLSSEPGKPSIRFQRGAQGEWQAREFSFSISEPERWYTLFADGMIKLHPGTYLEELRYLEFESDPSATAFTAFDPAMMKHILKQHYADFLAGEPPVIPAGESPNALPQPCGAALKPGAYAVYSGPGKQYYREAGGKAAVSANDWVQVFGTDGGWVLIQYRVRDALLRFGYIQSSALQNPDAAPPLVLESVALGNTENEFVTSNPLGMGGRIRFPRRGVPMTRLGTLGGYWMYVELTLPNGQPARMFAEIVATHG